jgi:hypothetical protein
MVDEYESEIKLPYQLANMPLNSEQVVGEFRNLFETPAAVTALPRQDNLTRELVTDLSSSDSIWR